MIVHVVSLDVPATHATTAPVTSPVAGVAAGGYAGNRVQKSMQESDAVTTTERRCRTVNEKSQRVVGYDVTYRLSGKEGTVRTAFRPGV